MRRARSVVRKATEVSLEDEIARLRGLDIETLRARWRTVFGGKAPPHLPRHLLFAIIAYRLQAEVFGDLDAETLRLLKKIDLAPSKTEAVPLTKALEQRRRELSPGTILIREWNGQTHRVTVVEQGFAWEGTTYDSLSKIAHAITGTKLERSAVFWPARQTIYRGRRNDYRSQSPTLRNLHAGVDGFRPRPRVQLIGRTVRCGFRLYSQPSSCSLDACPNEVR